jgi:hypothetical protein
MKNIILTKSYKGVELNMHASIYVHLKFELDQKLVQEELSRKEKSAS